MPKGKPKVQIVKHNPPNSNNVINSDVEQADSAPSTVLKAFQLHHLALHRFISRFLYSRQDIEDVAQEAFLRAYSAEKTSNIEQPKSYLFRVAKNVAVSQLRLKSRQITGYLEDEANSESLVSGWTLEDEVMAKQKLGMHCDAVAALAPQCRKVYLLRKVHGLRHKEIAARLSISISTVEKHLSRGVDLCDSYVRDRMDGVGHVGANKEKESKEEEAKVVNMFSVASSSEVPTNG